MKVPQPTTLRPKDAPTVTQISGEWYDLRDCNPKPVVSAYNIIVANGTRDSAFDAIAEYYVAHGIAYFYNGVLYSAPAQ